MVITRSEQEGRTPVGVASDPSDDDRLLDADELRELLPAALILESLAVRRAPAFEGPAIARLRAACGRMRHAAGRPADAARAEYEFGHELVRRCGEPQLRDTVLRVQSALLPYRRAAPVGAVHHDAIVDALERGDHAAAARQIRATFAGTLARLLAGVERAQPVT